MGEKRGNEKTERRDEGNMKKDRKKKGDEKDGERKRLEILWTGHHFSSKFTPMCIVHIYGHINYHIVWFLCHFNESGAVNRA
jgi:hypothetical protein